MTRFILDLRITILDFAGRNDDVFVNVIKIIIYKS